MTSFYINEHGAKFLLVRYEVCGSAEGDIMCATLRAVVGGWEASVPAEAFKRNFKLFLSAEGAP